MKDAEKMLCDYIYDFVDKNWGKIDKNKVEITLTKDAFLGDLKENISDALWVLFEVCDWGMDKKYLKDIFVLNIDGEYPTVIMIGTHYIKIDYSTEDVDFTYPKTKEVIYFD